ncbi:zinc finger protein 346 isoform X5 [Hylobates moloch]|uniref:Zinc finger protein 346 n=1 Tax=Nomascus leucogenys TaxID=61853 RepID=A0A2I3H4V0_NOMLE|nr:zinc finger protein 346 isoform X12 [Symphalangus syndactylus]XP_058296164.1 zinc finger protein 346 isoform X5 [Hylobates moloch]
MEYSAPATVQAADGGGAGPYNSSELLEGQEPDGVRFDRERARRLWEAVSGAQPVGREEAGKGYPCKTCKIVLNSIEQYQAHVSGFKHKNQSPKTVASSLGQIPMQRQPVQKDSTTLED